MTCTRNPLCTRIHVFVPNALKISGFFLLFPSLCSFLLYVLWPCLCVSFFVAVRGMRRYVAKFLPPSAYMLMYGRHHDHACTYLVNLEFESLYTRLRCGGLCSYARSQHISSRSVNSFCIICPYVQRTARDWGGDIHLHLHIGAEM